MSRPSEPSQLLSDARMRVMGYERCELCERWRPPWVSRCRWRRCPGYAPIWAKDTMRKLRENLRGYGGLVSMTTLTAPGEETGLVWDTASCSHALGEKCSGRKGCRVVAGAASAWNAASRTSWRELNRIAKQRADRRLRAVGHEKRGGLLAYSWELQKRGVWHLHIVLGMQTAPEREWARAYVEALRSVGPAKGFGFVDAKPLERPQEARRVASYLSKYLAKWQPDGTIVVSETVTAAGRTLLNYVSRDLTTLTGCTMRALRNARLVWAAREGYIDELRVKPGELLVAIALMDRRPLPARGP
jgi:hypothetical protein